MQNGNKTKNDIYAHTFSAITYHYINNEIKIPLNSFCAFFFVCMIFTFCIDFHAHTSCIQWAWTLLDSLCIQTMMLLGNGDDNDQQRF